MLKTLFCIAWAIGIGLLQYYFGPLDEHSGINPLVMAVVAAVITGVLLRVCLEEPFIGLIAGIVLAGTVWLLNARTSPDPLLVVAASIMLGPPALLGVHKLFFTKWWQKKVVHA